MDKYILNREESVLMVIDIQDRLVRVMEDKDMVIKNTAILLETSKELDIPVIITEQYPKGLGHTIEEIKDIKRDVKIFEKNSFTAYIEEVKMELKKLGRKKVIIVGMETHVCVLQTARDLLLSGFQVHIVQDAVCSRTKENYENALQIMREMGAVINNTETIAFDLLKVAGTPEFKAISKLIK